MEARQLRVLADMIEENPYVEDMDVSDLVDQYVLTSEMENVLERIRKRTRDELMERDDFGERASSAFGSVSRSSRTYKSIRDKGEFYELLDQHGIEHDRVEDFDEKLAEKVLEELGIELERYFEFTEREYVRRDEFDELSVGKIADERGL